ncbi:MAG: hypothetical protein ACW98D_18255 [Promethearchaeota archaeon]|jgi:hypothetical protein
MSNRKDSRGFNIVLSLIDNIKKIVFYIVIGIIVVIFLFNQLLGVSFAGLFFIIYLVSYLITLSSKRKLLSSMREYSIISDKDIANKLKRPIEDIRRTLLSLSKNQKKKKWLIVILNKRYIFLNENGVERFKQLYNQGYNEKIILENLQQEMKIRSRAEVKAIGVTLANYNRLSNER